jgi:YfiH family protein
MGRGGSADDRWRPFELAPGVMAAFTSRPGGVSGSPFDSLNLGDRVGDDPAAVARNRQLAAQACGRPGGRMAWMRQVHGADVAYAGAGQPSAAGSAPARGRSAAGPGPAAGASPAPGPRLDVAAPSLDAAPALDAAPRLDAAPALDAAPGLDASPAPSVDALFTGDPALALGVLVADCAPVLIADPQARIIGAAHAGREGMAAAVVLALVRAMTGAGADPARMQAVIGPAICGGCYEVPEQLRARIADAVPAAGCVTRKGSPGIDIRSGVAAQLAGAGVRAVRRDPRCTAETPALFSYRRDGQTGRFAGLVWLA